ncbi:MAG TPA: nuclear transport factor 2 family protein [Gaiellaceae bacterium]|nr:nuclear transport factor 2 family protein [Gaiellaceae bacterium]
MKRLLALVAVLAVAVASSGGATAARSSASPAAVARAWSKALNANDNVRAAELFAPNARIVQRTIDVRLTSRALAIAFNASLPCAGRVVAVTVHGNRAVATFVLGERPKHHCDGPGMKAAALFIVRGGKITLWEQIAVPKPNAGGPIA